MSTSTATETPIPAAPAGHSGKWATLGAVSLGVMMVGLDGTVVSVANPTIGKDLNASLADLQWVTNAYLLALAVLLVFGGRLGDRFGRRKAFMIGITGFALGSLGCGLSGSVDLLVVFRVMQGVFGALMLPATLACLRAAFPEDELDQAVGIWGGTSALAVALGPIIGGLLVEHVSWQSIFFLNLPLGAIALGVASVSIRESRDLDSGSSLDPVGVGLLSVSLFCLAWGLIKSQTHGWGAAYTLGFLIAFAVVLALFVLWEHRRRDRGPLVPLELFRNRSVSAGLVLVILGFLGLFGVTFFITLYLQRVHGYSPVQAGVKTLPLTGVFVLSAPLGGVITGKLGPRPPLFVGMVLMGVAFLGMRGFGIDTGYGDMWPWFLLIGIALGLIVVASTQAIVGNVPVDRAGVAGGMQQTANQLGGVLGTSVLGSLIVSGVTSHLSGRFTAAGLPQQLTAAFAHNPGVKEAIGEGIVPTSGQIPGRFDAAIAHASYLTFLDGLHLAMLVGACITFAGALLALLIQRGRAVQGAAAV